MEIPYEKVIPTSLVGEISDLTKRIVRKPCCTECYTSEIEEVRDKTKDVMSVVNELFESDEMRCVVKLFLLQKEDWLSKRGQSIASMGVAKIVKLHIPLPWESEVAVKTT